MCLALLRSVLSPNICVTKVERQLISIAAFSYSLGKSAFTFFCVPMVQSFKDSRESASNMPPAERPATALNQGPACVDLLSQTKTSNEAYCCDLLKDKHKSAIGTKRSGRGSLSSTIMSVQIMHRLQAMFLVS
jgi:hypothetical protein